MSDIQSGLWQINLQVPVTKLRPPDTQDTIKREKLSEHLGHQVLAHRLTLISAPAGSGKTTLAVDFVQSNPDLQIRWLSLDEDDNDVQSFLHVLVLAIFPNIEKDLLQMIYQGQISSQQVANLLINRLDSTSDIPIVVVLDDLHVLTNTSINEFLDYFVDYIPQHVHILVTTRYDPNISLAKLRARNELAEFRLNDLRFDNRDVDSMINGLLNLEISDSLIEQMVERTEGWVAGIRLLSLSLSKIDIIDRQQYIENLEQHDRYVFDLLAEEVLFQQSEDVRLFLLQTSILDDLRPELCDVVTQVTDSALKLAELHRNNLFVVAVGKGNYSYHALFRDFLREQLRRYHAQQLPELHQRAAKAHPIPARKIHHYLLAEAWTEAIPLIATYGRKLIEYSNRNIVAYWLEALPQEYHDKNGWILYLKGMISYHRGDYPQTIHYMEHAEAWFKEAQDSIGIFESIVMQSAAVDDEYDFDSQMSFAYRMEPHIKTTGQRLISKLYLAWTNLYHARSTEASQYFYEALELLVETPEKLGFIGLQLGVQIILVFDNLATLQSQIQHIIDTFDLDIHIFNATARTIFATIAFWQGNIAQARDELNMSLSIWEKLGGINQIHKEFHAHLLVSMAWAIDDHQSIEQLTRAYRNNLPGQSNLAMIRARWSWLQGDKAETRYILDHFRPLDELTKSTTGRPYRLSIEALLALDDGKFEVIEPMLIEYAQHQQHNYTFQSTFVLDLRVTLAFCYLQLGLKTEALETIRSIMSEYEKMNVPGRLAQESGFIDPLMAFAIDNHLYVDFARQVQSIRQSTKELTPITIKETGETLTVREVEILQMLMEGASNRAIADTCVISIPTVKTHVSRILQKLNVSSRTHAAAKAHELRLF